MRTQFPVTGPDDGKGIDANLLNEDRASDTTLARQCASARNFCRGQLTVGVSRDLGRKWSEHSCRMLTRRLMAAGGRGGGEVRGEIGGKETGRKS